MAKSRIAIRRFGNDATRAVIVGLQQGNTRCD